MTLAERIGQEFRTLRLNELTQKLDIEQLKVMLELNPESGAIFIKNSLEPSASEIYDIGAINNRFQNLYLANGTIFLDDIQIKSNGEELLIEFDQEGFLRQERLATLSDVYTKAELGNYSDFYTFLLTEIKNPTDFEFSINGSTYEYENNRYVRNFGRSDDILLMSPEPFIISEVKQFNTIQELNDSVLTWDISYNEIAQRYEAYYIN